MAPTYNGPSWNSCCPVRNWESPFPVWDSWCGRELTCAHGHLTPPHSPGACGQHAGRTEPHLDRGRPGSAQEKLNMSWVSPDSGAPLDLPCDLEQGLGSFMGSMSFLGVLEIYTSKTLHWISTQLLCHTLDLVIFTLDIFIYPIVFLLINWLSIFMRLKAVRLGTR